MHLKVTSVENSKWNGETAILLQEIQHNSLLSVLRLWKKLNFNAFTQQEEKSLSSKVATKRKHLAVKNILY